MESGILTLIGLLVSILLVNLMLQPLNWLILVHWPNWLWLALFGALLAWCLGND